MLINDLTNIDDEVFLFLDDYQWLTHPEIQSAISFLIEACAIQFSSRADHALRAARFLTQLRAQNRLLEVDAFALRFSLDETRAFLELEQIGGIESADVRAVHAKTEGWPAILRIIASTFSQSGEEFGQFASKLSGAAHTISTYFDEIARWSFGRHGPVHVDDRNSCAVLRAALSSRNRGR